MKRTSLFVSTLVLAALLLAACGGEETATGAPGIPGTIMPAATIPGGTIEATSTAMPALTETAGPDDQTTTPVVPVTGEDSPNRLTNLLDYDVWNQNDARRRSTLTAGSEDAPSSPKSAAGPADRPATARVALAIAAVAKSV